MEKAIETTRVQHSGVSFDIRWRPFELNPNLPKGLGTNKMEMYNQKFGKHRVKPLIENVSSVASSVGINMSYGGNVGNTFDSHRLVWYAYEKGGSDLQDKVIESLFKAYFEEEKCLSDHHTLMECANRVGLDATDVISNEELGLRETTSDIQKYSRSCRGVPFFIFNDQFSVSGAQESSVLVGIFDDILNDLL